jgi:CRISPR-associated endonuclease/helicase Cas3
MKQLNEILAKSVDYGSLTLLEHTQQVTMAIEVFAKKYNFDFDVSLCRKGAILHDLGKSHPHFQRKIANVNAATLIEKNEGDFIHRHEISSLAFLPCFPKEEWNTLIDLVVAHHKSIENDPSERGILDLTNRERDTIENHLKDWEEWCTYGMQILTHFDLSINEISRQDAEKALNYVVDYCENKKFGFSPLRGLLKSADHFASAFMHQTEKNLEPLFETPNLDFYRDEKRKYWVYPLSETSTDDARKHTLVVASTGAGKTDFLLRRTKGRVFYTLPFQASINAMYNRIKVSVHKFQPSADIRLLHATSKIVVGKNIDEQILQPLAGASVKILTPHQLAAIVFGTSGFETVMLDVQGTDVILDEIHTYSGVSRAMVLEIVKALLRLDCRLHIGTATMPSVLYNELKSILGGENEVYEVKLSVETLDTFDRHEIDKIEDEEAIIPILEKAFKAKEKVLIIYNTIKKAQNAYQELVAKFPNVKSMLIHSRFKRGDRVRLEKELTEEFDAKYGLGREACFVVSTQVVEVSLDISFDRMITQCAPLDGMIQRFGRVNRKRDENTIGKYKPVHVIKPSGKVMPYNIDVLNASFEQLPENFNVLKERDLQEKIDTVYPILETKEIDIHLIYKNGKYGIKELCNYKKAVLVDALEIESATCILGCDREAYKNANWEERLYLEIPINYNTIRWQKAKFEQLEIGSYPFIIPQKEDDYKILGLQIIEHDYIL